jgi:ribosomal protein L18
MATIRKAARQSVHRRIRKKVAGTAQRPRLSVHFSGKHVYAQVIDDDAGRTLAAASTAERSLVGKDKAVANRTTAEQVGKAIAERLLPLSRKSEGIGRRCPCRRLKILIHGSNNFRQTTGHAQDR